mgnify:CR=1 FL=1
MVIPIVFFLFILFSTETVIDTNEMKVKNNISSNELAKIPKNNLLKFRKVGIVSLNNDLNDKNYKLKTDTRKNNFPWIEQKLNYQTALYLASFLKQPPHPPPHPPPPPHTVLKLSHLQN